jgi:NhaC family Na+:H+ antiporter
MIKRERSHFVFSLFPLIYLLFFVILFRIFSTSDSLYGPHQVSLFLAGALALLQRINKSHIRSVIWNALKRNFISVLPAMKILFFVGMLIGAWASAGVLGSLVYAGTILLSPSAFLPGIAIVCGMSAVISGSSWTTAGTLGVALMGVGQLLGFPSEVCAGAIVSGCYFGDKLSPLSDTTNLASSLTDVPLTIHIRYMLRTTLPSFLVCLVFYYIWNLVLEPNSYGAIQSGRELFSKEILKFDLWNFIPVVVVFGSSMLGVSAILSLGMGIVGAAILSLIHGFATVELLHSLFFGFQSSSGDLQLDALLSGGGVIAILPTECLILTAVWFGGILEGMGYLSEILTALKRIIHKKWDVLLATMSSSFVLNLTTADQYLSLVVPARAFRNLANEYHLENKEVSRAIEDSGTISSPLIPWNSCGAFMATSLKVSTFAYLPYVWFNLIHIFFSLVLVLWKRQKENSN